LSNIPNFKALCYNALMIITIEERQFDTAQIKQLYPAAIVKTGFEEETTQVSLEWLDVESKGKVELVGYGIFVYDMHDERYSFLYPTKEALDEAIASLAVQLQGQ